MAVRNLLKNERGMATLESIPLIVIFVMLLGYGLGLYGVVHSATLNSIAARTYAFETFRHRADLTYLRDRGGNAKLAYDNIGFRYHAIGFSGTSERFQAPQKPITIGRNVKNRELALLNSQNLRLHNEGIYEIQSRNQKSSVSPAWIMVGYGICLNSKCGGEGN